MRFAAFVGTRDEADILPLTIEQLRRIGVELVVVQDAGSTDETDAYLAKAEQDGDIWIWHDDRADVPDEVRLAGISALAQSCGAEWVLFIDSDELPLPRDGSLHEMPDLESHDILSVSRFNVALGPDGLHMPDQADPERYDDVLVYAQPIPDFYHHMQRQPDTPWIRGVLEPKMLVRAEAVETLHRGSHGVDASSASAWRYGATRDLLLAHLPFRDLARFEMRSANIAEVIAANPDDWTGFHGWQWQRFARAHAEGRSRDEYEHQVIDARELRRLRADRIVRSVADVFDDPVPAVTSEEEWLAMAARAEPWLTAAGMVARREDIGATDKLEHVSDGGYYPVVLLPPDHVVKFHSSWCRGDESAEREAWMLRLMEADAALPTPRLVARAELDADLGYIVMSRVRGVGLSDIGYALDKQERRKLATWTGQFVRRLHALPLSVEDRERGWRWFTEVARWRYDRALESASRMGFAPALLERLPRWLPPLEELMGEITDAVVCHGDLGASDVLGRPAQPRFEPTGVIGLDASFVGHPLADVGAIWREILVFDHDALIAFVAASGLLDRPLDVPRHALAWTLMTPCRTTVELGDAGRIEDPDELAARWFGQISG